MSEIEETTKPTTKPKTAKAAAPTFGKAQLLASTQFARSDKYVLEAILDEGREYTLEEAKRLLVSELERTVR